MESWIAAASLTGAQLPEPRRVLSTESWIAAASLTDNLDQPYSCVFKQVQKGFSSWYFCRLCSRNDDPVDVLDKDPKTTTKRIAHLADPIHKQRAARVVQMRNAPVSRFSWSRKFHGDLTYYRSVQLESAVCRHIFAGAAASSQAEIERLVNELRLAERMVQLELALWKAACELSPPEDDLSPLRRKSWSSSGWKQLKPIMRKDPLTGITILVAPFLGLKKEAVASPFLGPEEKEEKKRKRESVG